MRAQEKDKRIARKLVALSVEDGQVSSERVTAVIEALREKALRRHVQIMRQYSRLIEREVAASTAVIETASSLDAQTVDAIQKTLSTRYERSISTEIRENADLIAGIRIHLGDDVWDDSVATRLETLNR